MKCVWMTFPEIDLAHDRKIEIFKKMNVFSEKYLDQFSKKCQ